MKFLPALRFIVERTGVKNGSFLAIRMKINQNVSSSMTSSWGKKKHKEGPKAMPKLLFVMCISGIFATLLYWHCGAFIGCPYVSKH